MLFRSERSKLVKKKSEINLSKTAQALLESRYLLKDKNGKIIETPEQMFRRVAKFVVSAEKKLGTEKKEIKEIEEKIGRTSCREKESTGEGRGERTKRKKKTSYSRGNQVKDIRMKKKKP